MTIWFKNLIILNDKYILGRSQKLIWDNKILDTCKVEVMWYNVSMRISMQELCQGHDCCVEIFCLKQRIVGGKENAKFKKL